MAYEDNNQGIPFDLESYLELEGPFETDSTESSESLDVNHFSAAEYDSDGQVLLPEDEEELTSIDSALGTLTNTSMEAVVSSGEYGEEIEDMCVVEPGMEGLEEPRARETRCGGRRCRIATVCSLIIAILLLLLMLGIVLILQYLVN